MNREQYNSISKWQKETFGEATAQSKLFHLIDEINELHSALLNDEDDIRLEFADCFILLFGVASSHGMNYSEIEACINEKMQINKKRKWGKPDVNGVVNHIKE